MRLSPSVNIIYIWETEMHFARGGSDGETQLASPIAAIRGSDARGQRSQRTEQHCPECNKRNTIRLQTS